MADSHHWTEYYKLEVSDVFNTWDKTTSRLVNNYRRFGGACCLHLRGVCNLHPSWTAKTPKMEEARPTETSEIFITPHGVTYHAPFQNEYNADFQVQNQAHWDYLSETDSETLETVKVEFFKFFRELRFTPSRASYILARATSHSVQDVYNTTTTATCTSCTSCSPN
jgi:hypothetical protein